MGCASTADSGGRPGLGLIVDNFVDLCITIFVYCICRTIMKKFKTYPVSVS